MKIIKLKILCLAFVLINARLISQVYYYNGFNTLPLTNYTTNTSSINYTTIPSSFNLINDGYKNNIGPSNNPNSPFNATGNLYKGWSVVSNALENDTFLVTTSWIDTSVAGIAVNRWVLTPTMSIPTSSTVLLWRAKTPDPNFRESYEVYATNQAWPLTAANFPLGNRLFTTAGLNPFNSENTYWTKRTVNVGSFQGMNLSFAFRDYSTNQYQLWIDDITLANVSTTLDAGINFASYNKYYLTSVQPTVAININSFGYNAVNGLLVNCQIGNSAPYTQSISITPGLLYTQSYSLNIVVPIAVTTAGNYNFKCWISSVNGITDNNQLNDTIQTNVSFQLANVKKRVLMEQFLSANDGESVDGQYKALALQNDSLVVVNVHQNDSLATASFSLLASTYPSKNATALFDRKYDFVNSIFSETRLIYDSAVYKSLRAVTPVMLSVTNQTYTPLGNIISFNVVSTFTTPASGDYRLNAYLIENNVTGNPSDSSYNGFNQLNNYHLVPWSPYYLDGYYNNAATNWMLKPWQYSHQNTLIYAFNGISGLAATIPSTIATSGQTFQQTYTLALPTPANGIKKYNPDNIYIVGMITENNPNLLYCSVLNCQKVKLTTNPEVVAVPENKMPFGEISVYPNPASNYVTINYNNSSAYKVELIDITGKSVILENINGFDAVINIDNLSSGLYLLKVSNTKGEVYTKKLLIER
ncbi:MAG: T9SS type A sorting domain-containing protein [Bacteroidetes bacterium]|nr:T9SS type A sorting domain-containing protein [Bacteroidota bacterium]